MTYAILMDASPYGRGPYSKLAHHEEPEMATAPSLDAVLEKAATTIQEVARWYGWKKERVPCEMGMRIVEYPFVEYKQRNTIRFKPNIRILHIEPEREQDKNPPKKDDAQVVLLDTHDLSEIAQVSRVGSLELSEASQRAFKGLFVENASRVIAEKKGHRSPRKLF